MKVGLYIIKLIKTQTYIEIIINLIEKTRLYKTFENFLNQKQNIMINPIILSDIFPDEAQTVFNHWIQNEPVTLLVIIGNDELAIKALKTANTKINSGSNFASVRAVHAKNPEYIKSILDQLHLKPGLNLINWNDMSNYILLSISNKYNIIGKVISRAEFPQGPEGYINLAILYAQAADKI